MSLFQFKPSADQSLFKRIDVWFLFSIDLVYRFFADMKNVKENFCTARIKGTGKSIVHSEWQEKLQGNSKLIADEERTFDQIVLKQANKM